MDSSRRKTLIRLLQTGALAAVAGKSLANGIGSGKTPHASQACHKVKESETTDPVESTPGITHVDSIAALLALDTSQLASGQRIEVRGYYAGSCMGGGTFAWAPANPWDTDGGTVLAPANSTTSGRFLRLIRGPLTPQLFGARGDGSDQYEALRALANLASAKRLNVHFPAGDYASSGYGLSFRDIAVSGDGEDSTVIRYTGNTSGTLVEILDGASISRLTLDGNVTPDPPAWNADNYDAFTGCRPLDLRGRNVAASDLRCINSPTACLRVEAEDFHVRNVRTRRSRGNHGDGIFVVNSRNGRVENCHAYDFTRIGFVSDTYGDSPKKVLSLSIAFVGCRAEYGHDASVLHDSTEYNAGFWAENSSDVKFVDCHSSDTTHMGFTATSGRRPLNGPVTYTLNGCTAERTNTGFLLGDLYQVPVRHSLTDCAALDIDKGFSIEMFEPTSHLSAEGLQTRIRGDSKGSSSFALEGGGSIHLMRIAEQWSKFHGGYFADTNTRYGAVSSLGGFQGGLWLTAFTSHGPDGDLPVNIKLQGSSRLSEFHLVDSHARLGKLFAESIEVEGCTLQLGRISPFTELAISDSRIGGDMGRINVFETTAHHLYARCTFDFTPRGGQLYLYNSDKHNARRVIRFEECTFTMNLTRDGSVIAMNAAPEVFDAPGSHWLTIDQCLFINDGETTTVPAIHSTQQAIHSSVTGHGNRKTPTILTLARFQAADLEITDFKKPL